MRVIWKDSRTYKTYHYRNHIIKRDQNGWITDVPGDQYIYHSAEMAHNAVDQMLGGHGTKPNRARIKQGVKIIGKKGGDNSCA
jgi:uncharacterized membrane protein